MAIGKIELPKEPNTVVVPVIRNKNDGRILDILSRLCDACQSIDGRIEPWATIRKDIERLK